MRRRPQLAGGLDHAAAAISAISDHGAAVAGIVLARGLLRRKLRCAWLELAIVGLPVLLVNAAAKRIVGRARPEGSAVSSPIVRRPSSSSFPSGHTLSAAASAVALPESRPGQIAGLIGASAVGWSRLRLGAHHRGDVVGGVVIGSLLGLALRPVVHAASSRCRGGLLAD